MLRGGRLIEFWPGFVTDYVTALNPTSIQISPAERLRGILPDVEIAALTPIIEEIEELKVTSQGGDSGA